MEGESAADNGGEVADGSVQERGRPKTTQAWRAGAGKGGGTRRAFEAVFLLPHLRTHCVLLVAISQRVSRQMVR